MKLPCEMIRDLLPLYYDGVCSQVSKTMVAEHLETCEACANTLHALDAQMQMPKLETDEAKPLKTIRTKWRRKNRRTGILLGIALFVATLYAWFSLTQSCSVPIAAEDYTIQKVLRFENGMVYLEYSHPYSAISFCADIHRTQNGEVHLVEYRPRICLSKNDTEAVVRSQLIDPERDTFYADTTGEEVAFTAFYLGCPDEADAVLLWSAAMDIPLATPEQEQEYLYNRISNW